jgi:UDP-N-acetylmuramyl pentapeptide synthase
MADMILRVSEPGDVLLVKASRGARAERILNYIKENKDRIKKA